MIEKKFYSLSLCLSLSPSPSLSFSSFLLSLFNYPSSLLLSFSVYCNTFSLSPVSLSWPAFVSLAFITLLAVINTSLNHEIQTSLPPPTPYLHANTAHGSELGQPRTPSEPDWSQPLHVSSRALSVGPLRKDSATFK